MAQNTPTIGDLGETMCDRGFEIKKVRLFSLRELMEAYARNGREDDLTRFTCYDCVYWMGCKFMWDAYNTQGDCLADK